jgi:hypothetical protein
MSQAEKSIDNDSERRRSPSFPVVPIDEAIDRARLIYAQDRRAFTDFETLAGHMGYTVKRKGGRSARMVATLKLYGLLEERNGQFRISETAWKILEMPEDSTERTQLIRQAALNPPMIHKILRHFSGELPSDATLRSHLLFQEKFNADSARDFIRVLRRTIEIANPSPEDYNAGEESEEAEQPIGATPMQQPPAGTATTPRRQVQLTDFQGKPIEYIKQDQRKQTELAFKLSRESEARIIIYGDATQEAIAKLTALLGLSQDTFPTQAELDQPRQAVWKNKDHDQPVTVTGEAGEHDGRRYMKIAESGTAVPEDELEFEDEGAA